MTFSFIIPAFEPDHRVVDLIKQLLEHTKAPICVVDDGSQNKLLFKDPVFQEQQVTLLHHAVNLGKGGALKTAFNYVLTHFPTIKAVVTLDADGQHTVQDVLKIAKKVQISNALVLGVRSFPFFDRDIPLRSWLGNVLTGFVWRFLMGSKITDTQTGLRGVPSSLMKSCLHILPNRYEFEMEMLLKAHEMNLPIEELFIETIYMDRNRGSHFNPFFDSIKIYFVLFRFCFSAFISTIIDYMAFYFFVCFFNIGLSFVFARFVSVFVNYNVNKNFVFQKEKGGLQLFLKYIVLFSINLYIGYSFINYIHFEGVSMIYSKIMVDIILFFFNFFVQKEWVFKTPTLGSH